MADTKSQRQERVEWFRHDRFGMFIHWGLYAIPARGEWVRSSEKIPTDAYQEYFEDFNPINYNPREWAKLAKEAGMKYAVLTAKHHDGFCLFDSKLTDYKSTNTACGRDLVREFLDAFRAEGLKVGLYYSLLDWYHPGYPLDWHHPDAPKENDPASQEKQPAERDFPSYLKYMHGQVRELLTNYGDLDIMWFDYSYDEMSGEKWEATKLVRMMRSLQPNIVIDNRLGCDIHNLDECEYGGDFLCPEQIMPPEPMRDPSGALRPWELCVTLNSHWGYSNLDKEYKSPATIIRTLIECVSKDGNLLVNVGPNAKGEIPRESADILRAVGRWMRENGESIYGCTASPLPKPNWGYYTAKGNYLYAHVLERGIGDLHLAGLEGKLKKARLVADWSEAPLFRPWNGGEYGKDAFIPFRTGQLPDDLATVYRMEWK